MLEPQAKGDRRARRHEKAKADIVEAAWELARRNGIGEFSLRQLAAEVELTAPSLYQYFETKNDLYDTMYRSAYQQLRDRLDDGQDRAAISRQAIKEKGRRYFDFCIEDPVRSSLIFDKPIPGFTPSVESNALAEEVARTHVYDMLSEVGVDDEETVRLFIALSNGVVAQQNAYNPGGVDWRPVLDRAVDMFLDHIGVP